MHCGLIAIEQPSARQHPGPCVDATDGCETRRNAGKVADQRGGGDFGLAKACDHDQRICACRRGEGAGGGQLDAAGQRRCLAVGGDHAPAKGLGAKVAVGGAQRVEGGGDLENRGLWQHQQGQRQRLLRCGEDRCAF